VSTLNSNRRILRLARDLGLTGLEGPVEQITEYCFQRIEAISSTLNINSLAELEQVVARSLNLQFEEIWSDADIERIVQKYAVSEGDFVFATVRTHFNADTFGTTFVRKKTSPSGPNRYVAVIDCRGAKAQRRYFTRWHEIAHLLALPPKEGQPVNRSSIKKSPTEQLMDIIAGTVGYFDPVFKPLLEQAVRNHGALTFAAIESLRTTHCPSASFQATLIASVPRAPCAAIYLEAKMGHKKNELRALDPGQLRLFEDDGPAPKLRIAQVTANDHARTHGLRFDRNMEVPEESSIARLFTVCGATTGARDASGTENLSLWTHSDGTALGSTDVVIEARRINDSIFALVRLG
jgi:hypothetical protein